MKALYRVPFDALERWSTGLADKVVVNSLFTKGIFCDAFPGLVAGEKKRKGNGKEVREPSVVYPCVKTDVRKDGDDEELSKVDCIPEGLFDGGRIILSINRFEVKKDISLAILAFAGMDESLRNNTRLIIAGRTQGIFVPFVTYAIWPNAYDVFRRIRSPRS